jgi:GNAT superfamily N-acetyltransferase
MDDLYVLPEARGQGIAGSLIAAVRAWCQDHDVTVLAITVTPEAQEAHDLVTFYRKQGFYDTGRKLLYAEVSGSSES